MDECLDNFNFELAIKFCERALDMEPENVEVLEMAGAVFLETGDVDKAKSVSFKLGIYYPYVWHLLSHRFCLFVTHISFLFLFNSVFQCRPTSDTFFFPFVLVANTTVIIRFISF